MTCLARNGELILDTRGLLVLRELLISAIVNTSSANPSEIMRDAAASFW